MISPSLFTFMDWRRKWQPTPVFLPRESQGQRSLVGCHLWGCMESETTGDLAAAAGAAGVGKLVAGASTSRHTERVID